MPEISRETITFQEIIDRFGNEKSIIFFEPAKDPEYLRIFEREKKAMGLGHKDITLQLPDDLSYRDGLTLGRAKKADEGEAYIVRLIPAAIEWSAPFHSIEEVTRHELAHVKNGDCDTNFSPVVRWLYYIVIAEPRAIICEMIRALEAKVEEFYKK